MLIRTFGALTLLVGTIVSAPHAGAQRRPVGSIVVSNMNDNTATILDAATGTVLATLPTGEAPHEVAISRDGKTALVSNYGVRGKPGNTITVIDVATATVARTLTITGYVNPHGMAFLPGDTTVAVTAQASQAVLIVDVRSGRVLAALPTHGRLSHMLALSANGDRIATANMTDGTVSDIDVSQRDSTRTTPVGKRSEGVAITPDGKFTWAGSNSDSIVVVVDRARGVPVDTLRTFGLPYRIGISPDGKSAVIADPVNADVRIFDAVTRRQRFRVAIPRDSIVATAEVPGSPSPEGVALSRDSKWAFVTLQGRNRVITIDLSRGAIVAYAPTGTWSDGVGYSPVVRARP
jgi:YVTN family beta-propeller protein